MSEQQEKARAFIVQVVTEAINKQYGKRLDEFAAKFAQLAEGKGPDALKRLDALEKEYEKLNKAMQKTAVQISRKAAAGLLDSGDAPAQKSLAKLLCESEEYKLKFGNGTPDKIELATGAKLKSLGAWMMKQTPISASANAGMIDDYRVPGVVGIPTRGLRIRDLIPINTLPAGWRSAQYLLEENYLECVAQLTAATVAGTTTVLQVESVAGFIAGEAIIVGSIGANAEEKVIDSIDEAAKTITLTSATANAHPVDSFVSSTVFSFTAEGKVRPRAHATFTTMEAPVKTLGAFVPVTREIMSDAAYFEQYIGNRLELQLALAEEQQILYGDGSGKQLQGILTNTGKLSYARAGSDTELDAIRKGITASQLAHLPPSGIVMHPTNWQNIELQKDSQGRYIWGSVTMGGEERLWRLPVVVSDAIKVDTALIGAFSSGAAIWDREQSNVRASESHADFFTEGKVAVIAEERIALATMRPEAFCAVNLAAP